MTSKEDLIRIYKEYKDQHHAIPSYRDFVKLPGIHSEVLETAFGHDAYSKLQKECGDEAKIFSTKRVPTETIMRQYGDLAKELMELKKLPASGDWRHRRLKPTNSGLKRPPHSIKWAEFPQKFSEWVETEGIKGYERVLDFITKSSLSSKSKPQDRDRKFEKLVAEIRSWSPGRGRNKEESYKVELHGHLKGLGYDVKEESGDSNVDLLINKKYMVEIKKDPNLGEYDRLFGQLARHLSHQPFVIALIFDAHREDIYSNFATLVDSYLNREKMTVEIIKK